MAHIKTRNVNTAFATLVRMIHHGELPLQTVPSRVGEVIQVTEPMIISYDQPRERVLFNKARDCNSYFHLFESLWMLAGRNDVAPLDYYSSGIAKIASDDGKTFNGAYGHRWKGAIVDPFCNPGPGCYIQDMALRVNQLKVLIAHLKSKPGSRRAVLSMWNVSDDLMKIDSTKDTCCNLNCVFEVENGPCKECSGTGLDHPCSAKSRNTDDDTCPKCKGIPSNQPRYLNMTVFNRSNDLTFGMLGANVVHFSFLLEYVASHLGLEVGTYNQITSNLHACTERWEPEKWLEEYQDGKWLADPYGNLNYRPFPLIKDPVQFDKEVVEFIDNPEGVYKEPFLKDVAAWMCLAFRHHKERNYALAIEAVEQVQDEAWEAAGREWIMKRKLNYERKQNGKASGSNVENVEDTA